MALPPLLWEWHTEASLLVLAGGEWEVYEELTHLKCPRQIPINLQIHEWAPVINRATQQRPDHCTQSVSSHWVCVVVCYTAKASWYTTLKPQFWRESVFDKNWECVFAIKCPARNGLACELTDSDAHLVPRSQSILCPQMDKKSAYPTCTLSSFILHSRKNACKCWLIYTIPPFKIMM